MSERFSIAAPGQNNGRVTTLGTGIPANPQTSLLLLNVGQLPVLVRDATPDAKTRFGGRQEARGNGNVLDNRNLMCQI